MMIGVLGQFLTKIRAVFSKCILRYVTKENDEFASSFELGFFFLSAIFMWL